MNWFITGISGFVGRYLADFLLRQGEKVAGSYLVDREVEDSWLTEKIFPLIRLDVREKDELVSHLGTHKYDYFVHLAAQSSVKRSFEAPEETFAINLMGSLHLLEAIRESGQNPRVILASSADVYGAVPPDRLPLTEAAPAFPENPYSISKYAMELLARSYAKTYGLRTVISRAFNHTGPGQSPIFVIPDFARQIAEIEAGVREPVLRVGNLDVERDFLDVRYVVRAYALLARNGIPGEVYNIASGKSYSVRWMLQKMLQMSEVPIRIEIDENKIRPVEIPVLRGDATKITRHTGWVPEIPIEQTLWDVLQDWRKKVKERRNRG